ncbi:hypothetical protein BB561_006041 [Smittium simulii]|uniref:Uncharacterized protein n=1 Tax=Smittium simulii TaxID=133385 RepID=A0A2T9Y6Y3_9FUNG|nr:hypothetical protein BB561_006041 [Smittium simulii]
MSAIVFTSYNQYLLNTNRAAYRAEKNLITTNNSTLKLVKSKLSLNINHNFKFNLKNVSFNHFKNQNAFFFSSLCSCPLSSPIDFPSSRRYHSTFLKQNIYGFLPNLFCLSLNSSPRFTNDHLNLLSLQSKKYSYSTTSLAITQNDPLVDLNHDKNSNDLASWADLDSKFNDFTQFYLEGTAKVNLLQDQNSIISSEHQKLSESEYKLKNAISNLCTHSVNIIKNNPTKSTYQFIQALNYLIKNHFQFFKSLEYYQFIIVLLALKKIQKSISPSFVIYLINEVLSKRILICDEYPLMISILGRAGDWESATMLFDMASKYNNISDAYIRSSIMYTLLINNRIKEANYIWNQALADGQLDAQSLDDL